MEEKEIGKEVAEESKNETTKISVSLSARVVNVLFAFASMFLLVVTKIVAHFTGSPVFIGIMSIFIYLLALCGVGFNLLKNKKPTVELWLSVGAFVLTMFVL